MRAGDEPLIQIFVHGFLNGTTGAYNKIHSHILAARPAGRVYLFHWPSGHFFDPNFFMKQQLAAQLGQTLLRHVRGVSGAREWPMNLIGHSLGARLIHYALEHYDWTPYHLENVVLMGSAATGDDDDWTRCADKVSGRLVHAWSAHDKIIKAPWAGKAGSDRLPVRHSKIRNLNTGLGHMDYWPSLEWVLQRSLGADFHQHSAQVPATCPFCLEENDLDPDRYECVFRRGGCGMYYEVAHNGFCYPVTNKLRCPNRACGCIGLVEGTTHVLCCPDCGDTLWEPGMRVPPSRQCTA